MNRFSEKAKVQLEKVVELFKDPDSLAEKAAYATIPPADMPSAKWSLRNRWIAFFQSGEIDCRGKKQWRDAGRKLKKGSHAVFILRPVLVDSREKIDAEGKPVKVLIGFASVPVFAIDQTEGEPVEYEQQYDISELPLIDVCKKWEIDVAARPFVGSYYGFYRAGQNQIRVCTKEEVVLFHELAHAADNRLQKSKNGNGLKPGQDAVQEVVAELSAAVLARLYGSRLDTMRNHYEYVARYAKVMECEVVDACLKVLTRVSEVVGSILEVAES